ncbi:MAG: hypothetical protein ACK4Y9_03875 [Hyphomonas sp.]
MLAKYVANTFGVATSGISLCVAFFVSGGGLENQGVVFWSAVLFATIVSVVLIIMQWEEYYRLKPKSYDVRSLDINTYMRSWLQSGGRALILSRDLTWVGSKELAILEKKARQNELEILVESSNDTVRKLESAGATVHIYKCLGFTPSSRFTIIDYDKNGARVAVGKVRGTKHLITEHHNNNDDVFVLATDLKNSILAGCRLAKNDEQN